MGSYDVFRLESGADDRELQAMALAARALREPLAAIMNTAEQFLPKNQSDKGEAANPHMERLNRSLYQMLRIISNMSDADSYKNARHIGMETVDFAALIAEIMEKAQTISQDVGITLSYTAPNGPILGMANAEKMERAVYNLLSNALKFSPAGSTVEAKLIKSGNHASFIISNQNLEPVDDNSFWSRYRREPAIEDNRFGLGLGMTLVSSIASAHGGTVLVDHPTPLETRVTMTVSIVKNNSGTINSPVFRIGDYAGGRDKGLLELSEILPADSYKKIN
jgi:signal transduction histidine kinase